MGVLEVTQAQYAELAGSNPSFFSGDPESPDRPVEQVNWEDAAEYCRHLTLRERAGTAIRPAERYRLPTEAEWEYACRAETASRFSFGDALECIDTAGLCEPADPYMWWKENTPSRTTQAAGGKNGNAWNLFDLHGNVLEWCLDWYAPYAAAALAANPTGPSAGTARVLRGGDWRSQLQLCRSACRGSALPATRGSNFGFRVVLAVETEQ
jgi:formylglycine-generating enzyme required for sulfatase activity